MPVRVLNELHDWHDKQGNLTYRELWRCNKTATEAKYTCSQHGYHSAWTIRRKQRWMTQGLIALILIKNHDLLSSFWIKLAFGQETWERMLKHYSEYTLWWAFQSFPKKLYINLLKWLYTGEREIPNPIVALSVQVDINTLRSKVSSWLLVFKWRHLGAK